jgi:hypothetical protein
MTRRLVAPALLSLVIVSGLLLHQKGEGEPQVALPAIGIVGSLHPFPVPILKSLALSARLTGGTIGDAGSFIDADGGVEWLPKSLCSPSGSATDTSTRSGRTTEAKRKST